MSFQGKKNIYICQKCGHGFVTVDVDEGVTPFMTSCHMGCGGLAQSMFYHPAAADATPLVEWYRPDPEALAAMDVSVRAHVAKGGLISRPVANAGKPAIQTLHGMVTTLVMEPTEESHGKPYLRLTFGDSGTVLYVTTNLAEMIGGVGGGVRKRHEDQRKAVLQ